jgi:hypothetical protein
MAKQRDLQPSDESDRMERLSPPVGYTLGQNQRAQDVLAVEAELLRSEGIDPAWPPLEEPSGSSTKHRH